jgi:hypothetical protein
MRYVTTEASCVSVLHIKAHDPGRAEWSHRRCTGSAFRKISISSTFYMGI